MVISFYLGLGVASRLAEELCAEPANVKVSASTDIDAA
jgi:hypothetical protein